jgi:hypothetical protein
MPAARHAAKAVARLTRLETLLFRLEAQYACLAWAFADIAGRQGLVFELGLGHGRTYDHLRTHLPERDIYVFDREVDCFPDCIPPPDRMILGELDQTLAAAGRRFRGLVVLAHSDVGSYDPVKSAETAGLVSRHLSGALAPGALVVSDLALSLPRSRPLALPKGAREGRYFLYRHQGG